MMPNFYYIDVCIFKKNINHFLVLFPIICIIDDIFMNIIKAAALMEMELLK